MATLRNGQILDKWKRLTKAKRIYAELLGTCLRNSSPYKEVNVELRIEVRAC
jgi:hypothetical protein